ncbi:MAG: sigma-70 family RNA polymerase sigma factor [Pirellulaceae bacterium]
MTTPREPSPADGLAQSHQADRDSLGDAISAVRRGDDSLAERRIFDEFWPRVLGLVTRRLDSRRLDGDDVAQEVFLKFFRRLSSDQERKLNLANRDRIFAFLATTTHNKLKDTYGFLTAEIRSPPGGERGGSAALENSQGEQLPLGDGGETPAPIELQGPSDEELSECIEAHADKLVEILDTLHEKFGYLTEAERDLLFWEEQGLTDAQIGERLGVTRRTVQNRRESIKHKIREASKEGNHHVKQRRFFDGPPRSAGA